MTLALLLLLFALGFGFVGGQEVQLDPELREPGAISQFWAGYTPFFSVPSDIDAATPPGCEITFVQVLSRHGARNPTRSRIEVFEKLIVDRIQNVATGYGQGLEFLKSYKVDFVVDKLTPLGTRESFDAGRSFYTRYRALAADSDPFIRTVDEDRVVTTASLWRRGFYRRRESNDDSSDGFDDGSDDGSDDGIQIIPTTEGYNNTLHHGLCTAFERTYTDLGRKAQAPWLEELTRPIRARLSSDLPGVELTAKEAGFLMQLCPFNTVVDGKKSPFCDLFTKEEWQDFDYLETLGKYYVWSRGNPLGPTQGVGFVNELIARLTRTPVVDRTTTNATLTGNPETFPLDKTIYADFTRGNTLVAILSALGLYDDLEPLSLTERTPPEEARGFSCSWMIPFASRVYVEKMRCGGTGGGTDGEDEMVRVIVNDRVAPLSGCGADDLGRCKLAEFVRSLAFARGGGQWDRCFE
ncbi:3-phytase A [Colletotrichum tanaceti]|uniref:Phytase A n=1 Tax=Colletotrichum tanaceti TaxID=1306861 RepID=A0A4V6Y9A9_9PEZI|nr:3-phytase A [Colletotrichum tanaceti]TKW48706.1 3-phytase A [Colletotrichum tanaceti]